ncbi:transposase [Colletotrichum tabaci]|uniref:Transposase n=1 Tax=Colletotrichum tabaci TaxID=1209068 RepID=A0AAV9SW58_9PEZI
MVRYSEDELNQALEAISNGLSLRKASLQYGVPRSTLQLRLQGSQARSIAFSDLQRLSPSQEAKLAEWVRIQHALGLPPSHQQVKEFAGRILHAMGDTQPVGRGWIQAFIRRNPSVKVQRSRSIDSRRVNGASTEVIRDWFKHLAIPEIISIKPANRYNMDETGILEGQGSNGLVLGMSETKSVRKKQPGSRAWVSIIECISALGYVLNPLVIYKGKAVQQQWFPLDLSPYEGWQFTATENGWTSDATAVEWLQKVFIPQTLPQGKEVRLLIMDGHGSHTTTDFMWLCYINNIHLLFLPPHTSHVLQPLDQSVFSPVKSAYRKELGYLSQWNDSTIVGKRNFIGCYQKARTAGMTMQNIRSGWKWTGLWPVSMAKPLMSSLLLPTTPKPSASSDQVSKGQSGGKEGKEAEGWASASSAVVWSTPRKMKDLAGQLKLFTELDNDASTQRLLFIKVKKGFSEQSYNLATAQHKLELLQAQVNNNVAHPLLGHPHIWATQKCLITNLLLQLQTITTFSYFYTEDEVNQALEAISNGQSIRKAAQQYGVPRTTLQHRLQGTQTRASAFSDLQRLTVSQEAKLAEWVRIQHALGLPPTHQQVKLFAERILHTMGDTQPIGRGWMQAFIRRNPSVKVQRSRPIDSRRVNGASTEVIRDWFKHLAMPEIISIKPANRYNMDETGILEGQGSNGLVLGMSETKSVRKKQPGSRAWVSIIECISALGHRLHPLIIYKGMTVQQQWFPLDLGPYEGWQFTATENGWTTDATAVEWLQKVFIPQTVPQGKEEVRLLILDGHGSHTTTDFMWLCYINNIHLLFLPPHTSHVLQPLDQSVFGPLKAAYRKELGYLSHWNDSTIVGKRNFLGCYYKAALAGMTIKNIRSGWKWTGLWPVSMAKPLMSSLLLPTTPKPSASSDQVSKGQSGGKEGREAEGWASASSAVVWSTPRKMKDLAGQLKLFTELDNDASTQRLLFMKVKKGFSEQSYKLATAQQQLELLQAQITNTAVRKRRVVQLDPNTKFATISDVQKAQVEAGEREDDAGEISGSEYPSEAESCIVVASRPSQ